MKVTKKIMEKLEMSDFEYFDTFGETKDESKAIEDFEKENKDKIAKFEEIDSKLNKKYNDEYCGFYDESGLCVYCTNKVKEELKKVFISSGLAKSFKEKKDKFVPSIVDLYIPSYRKDGIMLIGEE